MIHDIDQEDGYWQSGKQKSFGKKANPLLGQGLAIDAIRKSS
jgi:hypothetical protein